MLPKSQRQKKRSPLKNPMLICGSILVPCLRHAVHSESYKSHLLNAASWSYSNWTIIWHGYHQMLCSKTCLPVLVNSLDSCERNRASPSARVQVFPMGWERINNSGKTCFVLIAYLLSIQAMASWKILMNNKYKSQTLTGNSTRKWLC